jgi:peptidoglycan/xylan/chitin deacetylase (PgdA/CDA1 family)
MSAGWSAEEKDELATEISRQIGFDLDALRERRSFYLMDKEELADLDPELVDIQLHTHRHRTPRDESLFTRELTDNRYAIRELIPSRERPVHFCYPSGDYDLQFLPWLRSQGIVSATTCETGMASANDDPLLLPRLIDTMQVSRLVFESWLDGTASFLPQRAARAG